MELIAQGLELLRQLVNQEYLNGLAVQLGPWFYVLLFAIIFAETGLVVTPFLPGDSLLFAVGAIASSGTSPIRLTWTAALLIIAAVLGDAVNYAIGARLGPKVFAREDSWLLNKKHLMEAHRFYEKHGGKTIVLARFIPILRTFAPVVAGVGKMHYRTFLFFNIFGGIGWVCSMILIGYFLPPVLDPVLRPIFGSDFKITRHVEKVVIVVVLLSISPGIVMWLRAKLKGKPAETPPEAAPAADTANVA